MSFASVLHGAAELETKHGKAEVAIGRVGDLVDGAVARKFNLSSDAGAIFDVTADKLGMLAIAKHAWQKDLVPKPILAIMAAKHSINAAATVYNGLSDQQRRSIRPPKSGKYSMFADNISLGAFLLSDELDCGSAAYEAARALGYAAFGIGLAFGANATHRYITGDFDTDPVQK